MLGMVAVATGAKPSGIGTADEPDHVRSVEGWILGVAAQPTGGVSDVTTRESVKGSPTLDGAVFH